MNRPDWTPTMCQFPRRASDQGKGLIPLAWDWINLQWAHLVALPSRIEQWCVDHIVTIACISFVLLFWGLLTLSIVSGSLMVFP